MKTLKIYQEVFILSILISTVACKELGTPKLTDDSFIYKDGMGEFVEVDFVCYNPEDIKLTDAQFSRAFITEMVHAKSNLNYPLSYTPKIVTVFPNNGQYSMLVQYTATNGFGVLMEGTYYGGISLEGESVSRLDADQEIKENKAISNFVSIINAVK